MTFFLLLPFAAASFSLLLAFISLIPKKRSHARLFFFTGMAALAVNSFLSGLVLRATELAEVLPGLTLGFIVESIVSAAWLGFSLSYSRGDYRETVRRWGIPLTVAALLPIGIAFCFQQQLLAVVVRDSAALGPQFRFSPLAKALNIFFLVANLWILMNLEQTFRSAVGTMRWRIKFVVLGLAVIFGARLYVHSQAVLFSVYDPHWLGLESSGLLIGCVLLTVAYVRSGWTEIDVYPSRAILGSSVTVLIAGGYLFIVGVLANAVKRFGGAESFQFTVLVVLMGMTGLGVLLLSDRLRQRVHGFVSRHFGRAEHDSVQIWTRFSQRLANVKDQTGLCAVSARLVCESFEVLSVNVWLHDEQKEQFIVAASTAPQAGEASHGYPPPAPSSAVAAGLRARSSPFDLEAVDEPWAEELRQLNPTTFPNGGHRWCVPLRVAEQSLGALILADRVNGVNYTTEEVHLLQCIADQVTSVLLNLRLANEVALSRELEAFRTMSVFFVHDLKNTAASLNLMLRNLPEHFDDPLFREDALRAIGNTARRIEEMIGRLSALRQRPAFNPIEADLNQLVSEVVDGLDSMPEVELTKELQPLPKMLADREQIRSVVTNLLLNARDALGPGGRICLQTEHLADTVVLSITDNGCGMSAAFLNDFLFRPFQSTKKKGLGIGMYQSRMIVEAHGGSIRVKSDVGKGTTFRVSLPVKDVK